MSAATRTNSPQPPVVGLYNAESFSLHQQNGAYTLPNYNLPPAHTNARRSSNATTVSELSETRMTGQSTENENSRKNFSGYYDFQRYIPDSLLNDGADDFDENGNPTFNLGHIMRNNPMQSANSILSQAARNSQHTPTTVSRDDEDFFESLGLGGATGAGRNNGSTQSGTGTGPASHQNLGPLPTRISNNLHRVSPQVRSSLLEMREALAQTHNLPEYDRRLGNLLKSMIAHEEGERQNQDRHHRRTRATERGEDPEEHERRLNRHSVLAQVSDPIVSVVLPEHPIDPLGVIEAAVSAEHRERNPVAKSMFNFLEWCCEGHEHAAQPVLKLTKVGGDHGTRKKKKPAALGEPEPVPVFDFDSDQGSFAGSPAAGQGMKAASGGGKGASSPMAGPGGKSGKKGLQRSGTVPISMGGGLQQQNGEMGGGMAMHGKGPAPSGGSGMMMPGKSGGLTSMSGAPGGGPPGGPGGGMGNMHSSSQPVGMGMHSSSQPVGGGMGMHSSSSLAMGSSSSKGGLPASGATSGPGGPGGLTMAGSVGGGGQKGSSSFRVGAMPQTQQPRPLHHDDYLYTDEDYDETDDFAHLFRLTPEERQRREAERLNAEFEWQREIQQVHNSGHNAGNESFREITGMLLERKGVSKQKADPEARINLDRNAPGLSVGSHQQSMADDAQVTDGADGPANKGKLFRRGTTNRDLPHHPEDEGVAGGATTSNATPGDVLPGSSSSQPAGPSTSASPPPPAPARPLIATASSASAVGLQSSPGPSSPSANASPPLPPARESAASAVAQPPGGATATPSSPSLPTGASRPSAQQQAQADFAMLKTKGKGSK
ncbi:unnamed protein product [Amoebophrya sp. A120]|nr:unnamed protein product [Amoebophrya sp. A120]|eukprot:GSA120T00017248001.1